MIEQAMLIIYKNDFIVYSTTYYKEEAEAFFSAEKVSLPEKNLIAISRDLSKNFDTELYDCEYAEIIIYKRNTEQVYECTNLTNNPLIWSAKE